MNKEIEQDITVDSKPTDFPKASFEEFFNVYKKLYNLPEEVHHDNSIVEVERVHTSYSTWLRYLEIEPIMNQMVKDKDLKYTITEDLSTPELWLKHQIADRDRRNKERLQMNEYMKLPWYERELQGCDIRQQLLDAFINNEEGRKIRRELLVRDIPYTQMFDTLKHFASFINVKVTDEEINQFLETHKGEIGSWGIGVWGDGGRVFRTIIITCGIFNVHYTDPKSCFCELSRGN